jgi:DNA-binding NtrC family response regulator
MTVSALRTLASPRRNLTACIVGNDAQAVEEIRAHLDRSDFSAFGTTDQEAALERIRTGQARVVVADAEMNGTGGLALLGRVLACDPGAYVILTRGKDSLDAAVEAIKRGAYDYLARPFDPERLEKALDELAEEFARRSHIRELSERLLASVEFHGIIGKSPAIIEVFEQAQKLAKHFTNVLISGPTGSGKELVARALHQMSPVAEERFAVCNCSALVETLLESQLFGHVRGSFTGATDTRAGLFEYANGGIVFLDEVGEMALAMQAKLLRVIQNREIQRVGSPEVRKVEVRLIAATNRNLRDEAAAGRFREDLFYRLSTLEIRVPGLAERVEDIPVLVQFLLKKCNQAYGKAIQGVTRRAQVALLRYPWPGNVRELENVISGACIAASSNFIDTPDLPPHLQRPSPAAAHGEDATRLLSLGEVRRRHIARVLEACHGNRVRAAQALGIGRTSLYRFLKRETKQAVGSAAQ